MNYDFYDYGAQTAQIAKVAAYRPDRASAARKSVNAKLNAAKARGDAEAVSKYQRVNKNLDDALFKDMNEFGKEVKQDLAAARARQAANASGSVPVPRQAGSAAGAAVSGSKKTLLERLGESAKKIPGKKALPYAGGLGALGLGSYGAYRYMKNRKKDGE